MSEHQTVIFSVTFITAFAILISALSASGLLVNQASWTAPTIEASWESLDEKWHVADLEMISIEDYVNDTLDMGTTWLDWLELHLVTSDLYCTVMWDDDEPTYIYFRHWWWIVSGWISQNEVPYGKFSKANLLDNLGAGVSENVSTVYYSCSHENWMLQFSFDEGSYSDFEDAFDDGHLQVTVSVGAALDSVAPSGWALVGRILVFQGFELHQDATINTLLNALFVTGPMYICIAIIVAYFIEKLLPFF